MINLQADIIPYEGTADIKLYSSYDEIEKILVSSNLSWQRDIWDEASDDLSMPWTIIIVYDYMKLFFSRDKLFKIVLLQKYTGTLPNGISTGISLDKAMQLDNTLHFDDWEEIYISSQGYWLEDNLTDNTVDSISIAVKELDTPDFENASW